MANDLQRGTLDVAFLRHEPDTELAFRLVETEPLVAILPSDHPLAAKNVLHPRDFAAEAFIGISAIPRVLRAAVNGYLFMRHDTLPDQRAAPTFRSAGAKERST